MTCGEYIALIFMMVGLIGCEKEHRANTTFAASETAYPSTGFADYDWLPAKLKRRMDHLALTHTDRHFNFYYYFQVDDINRHFYVIDPGLKVIEEMPVTDEEALLLIEDKLYDATSRKNGIYVAWDTTLFRQQGQPKVDIPYFRQTVAYVLPDQKADFGRLRVAIVEDSTVQNTIRYYGPPDPTVYDPSQVDTLPRPARGMDYFQRAIFNDVQSAEVFGLYDTGTVEVEFTVWGYRTHSPNLVHGFSSRSDTHEAYQADGEFIKAINRAKVWWHHARKDGRPVQCRMRVTFNVSDLKNLSSQSPTL